MAIEKTAGRVIGAQALAIPQPSVTAIESCRGCGASGGAHLLVTGSLGNQYVVDFPEAGKPYDGLRAPLDVVQCSACGLIQLYHTVDPDRLFKQFWYRSGINPQMVAALGDVVKKSTAMVDGLQAEDCVADIGSNDGTLLKMYPRTVHTVGFEPCEDLVRRAEEERAAEVLFATYFRYGSRVRDLFMGWQQPGFKIITALAMFYDVDNPKSFLFDILQTLHSDGVFVIQMNHWLGMLKYGAFDNISHEHLCYYSLGALTRMLKLCGLGVLDVEENDVNGGSIRVYIGLASAGPKSMRVGDKATAAVGRVIDILQRENAPETLIQWKHFFETQKHVSALLSDFISEVANRDGDAVYVYGASTRGTTLLQTLDKDVACYLRGAAERDDRKYGKMMVGTWTPIIPEAEAREKADYFLVLPYHFLPSILEREKDWLAKGGKLIVPLPEPRVIDKDGERSLL